MGENPFEDVENSVKLLVYVLVENSTRGLLNAIEDLDAEADDWFEIEARLYEVETACDSVKRFAEACKQYRKLEASDEDR